MFVKSIYLLIIYLFRSSSSTGGGLGALLGGIFMQGEIDIGKHLVSVHFFQIFGDFLFIICTVLYVTVTRSKVIKLRSIIFFKVI